MKRIFMTMTGAATVALAIALNSCNNAEQVKKQVDEQNAKIQTQVDEKLNALQDEANKACSAKVDSLANAKFAEWKAEEEKSHKGGKAKPKPKPKPEPKKEQPKPVDPKKDKMTGAEQNNTQEKKDKMGGQPAPTNTDAKKKKMGGN
jgi:hypothetical protein